MKKNLTRAVVLGLLCASAVAGSAYAEYTLDVNNSSSTNLVYDYNTRFSGAADGDIISINVSRDQTLTFNNNHSTSSLGFGFSSEDFKITNNNTIGILNNSGATTVIDGNGLWISSVASLNNVSSIVNQSGTLKITNKRLLVSDKVENFSGATMIIDGDFELDSATSISTVKSIGIVNDGILQSNGTMTTEVHNDNLWNENSFYDGYSGMYAIDNKGTLNAAKVIDIYGDVKHSSGAKTQINLVSDGFDRNNPFGIKWGTFNGNIIDSDQNFNMRINKWASWMPRNQVGAVEGIDLNGGWISLSIDNYIWNASVPSGDYSSYEWNDNYDTLTLKNITISKNDFSSSKDIESFVATSGGFSLSTDLANNRGDKIIFTGSINKASNIDKIGLVIWDKNSTPESVIKEEDGKSVTIIEAPEANNMKFESALGFGRNYQSFRVYDPIIKEVTDGITHKWNFVGWEKGGNKTVNEETVQQEDAVDLNATELDNTLKRINDIRTDPSEVGAWIRGESGKMKIRSYSYKYNLTSGGYDWDFESDAAKMFLGFGISYAKNDCDTGMIGDTKSMGYNLYGSWLGKDNKDYVDVILKYGKLDKKYAGLDDNNVFVRGDYDKNLFSIAAKYGRRIEREDGWYYEPSVGLTWGRIGSADFTDSQGIHIHADSSTSKMASLGMQVGKNVQGTEFYGLLQVRHDFDGKMHVSVPGSDLPGSSVYDDMGGTWYKVGIGAARKINKNNSFYLDLEKDFGNKVKKPYSIGAGYRYTW